MALHKPWEPGHLGLQQWAVVLGNPLREKHAGTRGEPVQAPKAELKWLERWLPWRIQLCLHKQMQSTFWGAEPPAGWPVEFSLKERYCFQSFTWVSLPPSAFPTSLLHQGIIIIELNMTHTQNFFFFACSKGEGPASWEHNTNFYFPLMEVDSLWNIKWSRLTRGKLQNKISKRTMAS